MNTPERKGKERMKPDGCGQEVHRCLDVFVEEGEYQFVYGSEERGVPE